MLKLRIFLNSKGRGETLIFLIVIIGSTVLVGGFNGFGIFGTPKKATRPVDQTKAVTLKDKTFSAEKTLQLNVPVSVAVSTPTPINSCSTDQGQTCNSDCQYYLVTCQNQKCTNIVQGPIKLEGDLNCDTINNGFIDPNPDGVGANGGWCATDDAHLPQIVLDRINYYRSLGFPVPRTIFAPTDGTYCIKKPVIYLYPKTKTFVDVKLTLPGSVIKSIPSYPPNGWHNVLAFPDGTLFYNGQTYSELFYESLVNKIAPPINGLIIPTSGLAQELHQLAKRFGLNEHETNEFVAYWLTDLLNLKSRYILFSVFALSEKEKVDKVTITPTPDTFIQFLAYFKPLAFPITVDPLVFPASPPKRNGFTVAEWGGVIDKP